MLSAVAETADWGLKRIHAVRELRNDTKKYIERVFGKKFPIQMLGVIFAQPYCRITNVMKELGVSPPTASSYLRALCIIGVLREGKIGRVKLFVHDKYLKLIIDKGHDYEPYSPRFMSS